MNVYIFMVKKIDLQLPLSEILVTHVHALLIAEAKAFKVASDYDSDGVLIHVSSFAFEVAHLDKLDEMYTV